MLNYHAINGGIKPVLLHWGGVVITSYAFFVFFGLLAGGIVYYFEAKKKGSLNENSFLIAFGSLAGGILGAKLLEWSINFNLVINHIANLDYILSGRTIVGGLIGGVIGSNITKKILRIKEKKGNLFAPAVALGVAVGRIGCFFYGCCYGKETFLPWGVNFGDGVLRHPTQIYESFFMLGMFFYLEKIKSRPNLKPGELFKILMISYFIFRFFIEFIRVEKIAFFGLTVFQIISMGAIIYLIKDNIVQFINKKYARRK